MREEIFLLIIFAISIYLFKKSSLCNWQDSYNISMELHFYVAWTYCSFFAWFGVYVKREVPLLNNQTVPINIKTPFKYNLLHFILSEWKQKNASSRCLKKKEKKKLTNKIIFLLYIYKHSSTQNITADMKLQNSLKILVFGTYKA